jgi:Galactose oxidase, central domain
MGAWFWTQKQDIGPPPRFCHAMTYDTSRQKVVLFGGLAIDGAGMNDTWEWDGSEWTQVADTGPSPRLSHAMTYDASTQRVVFFGGHGDVPSPSVLSDTWKWDGSEWTQVADTGPSPRLNPAMTYNASTQRVVLFGGLNFVSPISARSDTWELNNNEWKQVQDTGPGPLHSSSMADSIKGLILFGGTSINPTVINGNTWLWTGKFWTQIQNMGPMARESHAMVYDSQRKSIVLFGGRAPGNVRLGDTWELEIESIPE